MPSCARRSRRDRYLAARRFRGDPIPAERRIRRTVDRLTETFSVASSFRGPVGGRAFTVAVIHPLGSAAVTAALFQPLDLPLTELQ